MPIRSPRGRAAAYRGIWQWPLQSPVRLAITVAVVVAVALGVSLATTALGGGSGGSGLISAGPSSSPSRSPARPPGSSGAVPGGAAATVLPPVPGLGPLPLSQAPPAALEVAARWSAAWLRPPAGTTAQQWLEGLRATTTEEYFSQLTAVDPANIPATRVTGQPRPVSVAARSVQVEVPTDALTLIVLVVDTGRGWQVAGHDRA